jgi:MFS family permease
MTRLRESLAAGADVFRIADMRRLQLAYLASLLSLWSFSVGTSVYAFDIGGAGLVGVLVLTRMLPAALVSPLAAALADRYPRRLVLLSTDLIRAGLTAAAAASIWLDLPPASVFVLTGLLTLVSTAFEPAKNALLPDLAPDPQQLTAANVVTNTFESASIFAGPALGGLLLAFSTVPAVFVVSAGLLLGSAALLARLQATAERSRKAESSESDGVGGELTAGLRTVAGDGRLRLVVGMMGAQTLVSGMLSVLIVVLALDLLDMGNGGVGLLDAATGVGGLIGGVIALSLAGGRRLAPAFGLGMVLWGAPIALIAAFANPIAAVALLAVVGVGNTFVDSSAITLLQRAAPDEVRARVFGVLEGLIWGSIGIGAALVPALIALLGIRGTLVATGLLLPSLTALTWTRIVRLDEAAAPPADLALLRGVPVLAPLAPATLEALASRIERARFAAGDEVTRQGEPGERFYVIASGEVEVFEDGVRVRIEGPGEFFGEIALLRDSPRTATVRALGDLELLALGRDDFIPAVTGHADSAAEAEAVIAARLGSARPSLAML